MCTVTIVPHTLGCTVMCNRDERNSRAPATAPRVRRMGARLATYPLDPDSGGTWIGANDAGLVIALLNSAEVNQASPARSVRSRGLIIPALLRCASLSQVVLHAALGIDPASFDKFKLVALAGKDVDVIESDGTRLSIRRRRATTPLLFTSSSLGDAVVEAPRRRLFEEMVLGARSWLHAQRRFHDHQWPDRPEVSVRMARNGAKTVSRTCIDLMSARVRLTYEPIDHRDRAA